MRSLCLFLIVFSLGCQNPTSDYSNVESLPDSQYSRQYFEELFKLAPTADYSEIRLFSHIGLMDQYYLFSFNFADDEKLIAMLEHAGFKRQITDVSRRRQIEEFVELHRSLKPESKYDTADDISLKYVAAGLDEVGSKGNALDFPDWWLASGRIKQPVWHRKNSGSPWGETYVWLNTKSKKAYAQTQ